MLLETTKDKCLDFKYDKMIKEMRATSWNASDSEGGKINNKLFQAQFFFLLTQCDYFHFNRTSVDLPDMHRIWILSIF